MSLFRFQLVTALVLVVAGCSPRTVSTTKSAVNDQKVSSDDVLVSAVYQLHPENFGINSSTEKPVSLLNTWRVKHAEQTGVPDEPTPVTAPEGWIPDDETARLAQPKFDVIDAIHIRDALFFHAIGGYLSDRGRDELQRARTVIDFVCRNISLWKDDELELPLPTFMSLQLGRGSADDRAWVCAEILRQLRVDSIILRAKSDVKQSTEKWLFGVLIDKNIYLFDLRLGLPILKVVTDESSSPVTLSEITSHPEWLEQLSVNEPYRLTANDISEASVSVISGSSFWCRRLLNLEQVLPAKDSCVIYDPLMDQDRKLGLLHRVSDVGGWPISELKLWQFPKRQSEASRHMTEEMSQELQRLATPLNLPIPVKYSEDGKATYGTPERKLQRFRSDHLLGKFAEATQRYLSIRHLEVEQYPPDIERLNRMASEDAFYWTSLCKYELGEYETAVEQLSAYLKKYDRKGKWYFSARLMLAQSHAKAGRFKEAIETLERTSSEDPYRAGNAIRMKQWAASKK